MWQRFKRWLQSEWPRWWPYVFAIAITEMVFCLFIEQSAARYVPVGLGLLFAVVLSAYVGGFWPGLLSTLIIAAPLKFIFDRQAISVPGIPLGPPSLLFWFPIVFGLMGAMISAFFEALHRSRRASNAARSEVTAILANISEAIVTTDALGRIQYVNRAATLLLRRDLPDIVGQPFESVVKIFDTTDTAHAVPLVEQVRSSGHTVHLGNHQVLVQDDGTHLAIEATAAPVRDLGGQLVSVVMTLRECTEQRQVETMLRERLVLQSRFGRIAAVVPGAIYEYRMGVDGRVQLLYASQAFEEILGFDPRLFADDASAWTAGVYPGDIAKVNEAIAAAMLALTPINIEHRVITPHRGLRWVVVSGVPLREADGSTLWHGIFMDVTERKRAEERLRTSQLQLRAALDAGAMGVITHNLDARSVELDPLARRLWGLDKVTEPLTYDHLTSVLHPDHLEPPTGSAEQTQFPTGLFSREYRLLLDGKERWLAGRGRVYRDEVTGTLFGAGVFMDVTQQRHIEAQRLHSQKLEALGVLAGGIAHDFNNLLLAISGNAKLLLADLPEGDPTRASAVEIDKAASRAAELVRRILSFSSGQEPSQTEKSVALRPVLDEALGLARAVLPTTVAINVSIPETLPEILASGGQVHQALINLLTNAADAAVAVGGGAITLEVVEVDVREALHHLSQEVKPGQYVCITVTDAGKGIDPAVLPRIFDPFFTTKASGRGTGLGLAIVHGIMKSIDGAVTVLNTPGHGVAFTLYFPTQQAAAMAATPVAVPAAQSRSMRILYVDDEESLIFLMTRTLERMGHRVTAYLSPAVALEKFMANADAFDLVVSDMSMPGLSGIELAERMLAVRPQLPFIITSGFVDAADVERAHAVGVRQMIIKPNTVDELSVVLATFLGEQDAPVVSAIPASPARAD